MGRALGASRSYTQHQSPFAHKASQRQSPFAHKASQRQSRSGDPPRGVTSDALSFNSRAHPAEALKRHRWEHIMYCRNIYLETYSEEGIDFARLCQTLPGEPDFARLCRTLPDFARLCQTLLDFARLCQTLLGFVLDFARLC